MKKEKNSHKEWDYMEGRYINLGETKMNKINKKKVWGILLMVVGGFLIATSVWDFDRATNGIELFKAIFWMVFGAYDVFMSLVYLG